MGSAAVLHALQEKHHKKGLNGMKCKKLTVLDGVLLALTVILGLILIFAMPAAKEANSKYDVGPYWLLRETVTPVFLLCLGYIVAWFPVFLSSGKLTLNKSSRMVLLVPAVCIVFIYAVAILELFFGLFHISDAIWGPILQHLEYLIIAGVLTFFCTHLPTGTHDHLS